MEPGQDFKPELLTVAESLFRHTAMMCALDKIKKKKSIITKCLVAEQLLNVAVVFSFFEKQVILSLLIRGSFILIISSVDFIIFPN